MTPTVLFCLPRISFFLLLPLQSQSKAMSPPKNSNRLTRLQHQHRLGGACPHIVVALSHRHSPAAHTSITPYRSLFCLGVAQLHRALVVEQTTSAVPPTSQTAPPASFQHDVLDRSMNLHHAKSYPLEIFVLNACSFRVLGLRGLLLRLSPQLTRILPLCTFYTIVSCDGCALTHGVDSHEITYFFTRSLTFSATEMRHL